MKTYLKNGGLLLIILAIAFVGFVGNLSASGNLVVTTVADQTAIAITVYNDGTGLVKDTREIDLPSGEFALNFMDVSKNIDPTSVNFVSNTDADSISVLEQNYEYDLVSSDALYEKHIDKQVTVRTSDGEEIEGTLLGYESGQPVYNDYYYDDYYYDEYYGYDHGYGGYDYGYDNRYYLPPALNTNPSTGNSGSLILMTVDGVKIIDDYVEARFEELPEGLITRPTLKWNLHNGNSGTHEVEMSYLTRGISWRANYVAVVNDDDTQMDLSGWVTINNTSGTSFFDAVLKLVAGEINRVQPEFHYPVEVTPEDEGLVFSMMPKNVGFEEESFFEYHLYTLGRPATVLDNQQKQISLLEGNGVDVEKLLIFSPGGSYYAVGDTIEGDISIHLTFMNEEENHLGIPLPKGTVRVYKKDSSGSLQFVGEDSIDHTPKDEEIEIFLGNAFDIVGERTVMDRRLVSGNTWDYDVKVTIRNHKDAPVEILYRDFVWGDWEMRSSTLGHIQTDASTLEFKIPVASDGETVLEYTIRRNG